MEMILNQYRKTELVFKMARLVQFISNDCDIAILYV